MRPAHRVLFLKYQVFNQVVGWPSGGLSWLLVGAMTYLNHGFFKPSTSDQSSLVGTLDVTDEGSPFRATTCSCRMPRSFLTLQGNLPLRSSLKLRATGLTDGRGRFDLVARKLTEDNRVIPHLGFSNVPLVRAEPMRALCSSSGRLRADVTPAQGLGGLRPQKRQAVLNPRETACHRKDPPTLNVGLAPRRVILAIL